uniref:Solute carrier family 25 member 32 n=1 Tax=Ciona savignyi TaxID=51511 RepID=H2YHB2_CIOSA
MIFYIYKALGTTSVMTSYKHFVAGVAGGTTATCILHPLDLIKIRFSVSDGLTTRPSYSSMWDLTRKVWRTNGVRGLYTGVTPNIIGAGLSWGLYFFFYNTIKSYLNSNRSSEPLTISQYIGCGVASGSIVLAITNPVWVAKTRLCLQYETQNKVYRGMSHTIIDLYKKDGVKGLYKGFVPGLFGTSHGAIQFLVYEKLKIWNAKRKGKSVEDKMATFDVLAMSAVSKLVAASATYPYQVVRSRLQDQNRVYIGVTDVVKTTFRNESWRGFYKGLSANLVRVTPACCITFYTYEMLMYYLPDI